MTKHLARPIEIELKLRLPPGSREALEQLPLLQAVPAEQRRETTTYFDTGDQVLASHGFSLRVRASGNARIQTLKTSRSEGGAAAHRGEWEWPVDGDAPDLGRLVETPAGDIVTGLDGRLRPLFATEIERRARLLTLDGGTKVEAALDQGAIVADGTREPVDELELELKGGRLGSTLSLGNRPA